MAQTLTPTQIDALPYDVTTTDIGYRTAITHDHDAPCDDCDECEAALASIQQALPDGWLAEWTGDGNGDDLDVDIAYRSTGR